MLKIRQYKWYFNKYSQYNIIEETEDWLYCKKDKNILLDITNNFWDNYNATNKAAYKMDSEIFNACPFLDKIFKNFKVLFVCLCGSALYNIIDNASDYDLAVFVDKNPDLDHNDDECLFYKGRKLHWYYWTLEDLIKFDNNHINSALIKFYYLEKKHIIYQASADYKLLLKTKNIIAQIAIQRLLKNNTYAKITKLHKQIVAPLLIYSILNNKNVDMLITSVKRSKYINISEDLQLQIKAILKALDNIKYNYINNLEAVYLEALKNA